MAKKDVFQKDKFGVRFFIYNNEEYFVVNDLCGPRAKSSLSAIKRYLLMDPKLIIFGINKSDAKVPKMCLSFARYKVLNKSEIKDAINSNSMMTLSEVSMEWLAYHKIKVKVSKRRVLAVKKQTAEVLYRKELKRRITCAANHITENREIV